MSDISTVTNLLVTANEGFNTTLGGSISSGANIVPLTSVTGLTNGSTFVGVVEPGLTNEQVFTGVVDTGGSRVTDVKWTKGSNTAHSAGAVVVDYITSTAFNMLSKAIGAQHNQDGSHGAITATSLSTTGGVTTTALTTGTITATGDTSVGGNLTLTGVLIPSSGTTASASSITPSGSFYTVTALAAAATINLPAGTPVSGQTLLLRFKDNGTARALTWDAGYRAVGVTIPTTTVISKVLYVGAIYNSQDSKWDVISVGRQ